MFVLGQVGRIFEGLSTVHLYFLLPLCLFLTLLLCKFHNSYRTYPCILLVSSSTTLNFCCKVPQVSHVYSLLSIPHFTHYSSLLSIPQLQVLHVFSLMSIPHFQSTYYLLLLIEKYQNCQGATSKINGRPPSRAGLIIYATSRDNGHSEHIGLFNQSESCSDSPRLFSFSPSCLRNYSIRDYNGFTEKFNLRYPRKKKQV